MNDHAVANRHIVAQRVRAGIAVRAVVTISALFAGCGGSGQPNTVVRTVTAPPATVTATTPTTTATTATPTDCNALGINSGRLREGTCTKGGRMFTIVNKSSTLRLLRSRRRSADSGAKTPSVPPERARQPTAAS